MAAPGVVKILLRNVGVAGTTVDVPLGMLRVVVSPFYSAEPAPLKMDDDRDTPRTSWLRGPLSPRRALVRTAFSGATMAEFFVDDVLALPVTITAASSGGAPGLLRPRDCVGFLLASY